MENNSDKLIIGNKTFTSRLMLGTGKYKTMKDGIDSITNSECEIVTVAIRRLPTNLKHDTTNFLNNLDWKKHWLLPNTAGSQTADEAIRMAFLGHELACQLGQEDNFFVKLEVISDPKYLLPDPGSLTVTVNVRVTDIRIASLCYTKYCVRCVCCWKLNCKSSISRCFIRTKSDCTNSYIRCR